MLVPDLFLFFKKALNEVEAIGLQLGFNQGVFCFNIFRFASPTFDPEICSILIFRKGFETSFSATDHISLSDCFYFLKYWAICVL